MQDKDIHISKKFTNRAWGEMRKLLDEEMPAQDTGRRRVGWWFLFIGLTAGLAGGMVLYNFYTKKTPSSPSSTPTEQKKLDIPVAGITTPRNEISIAAPANEPKIGDKSFAKEPSARHIASNTAEKPDAVSTQKTFSHEGILPSSLSVQIVPNTLSPSTEESAMLAENNQLKVAPEASTPNPPVDLTQLPGLELLPLPDGKAFSFAATLPNGRPFTWTAFGSGITGLTEQANGLAAGVLATRRVNDSRFSIESGLGYAFIQQPLTILFTASAVSTPNSPAPGFNDYQAFLGESSINKQSGHQGYAAARLVKSLNLHYVNLPLAVNYRMTPAFRVQGGLNVGVLVYNSSNFATGGIWNRQSESITLDEQEAKALGQSGNIAPAHLRNLDFAAVAGIGYRLTSRLDVNLQYQAGLTDIIPDNQSGDHNRLLRFSLLYLLKN
jgi:hypothetical protein